MVWIRLGCFWDRGMTVLMCSWCRSWEVGLERWAGKKGLPGVELQRNEPEGHRPKGARPGGLRCRMACYAPQIVPSSDVCNILWATPNRPPARPIARSKSSFSGAPKCCLSEASPTQCGGADRRAGRRLLANLCIPFGKPCGVAATGSLYPLRALDGRAADCRLVCNVPKREARAPAKGRLPHVLSRYWQPRWLASAFSRRDSIRPW